MKINQSKVDQVETNEHYHSDDYKTLLALVEIWELTLLLLAALPVLHWLAATFLSQLQVIS